MKAMQIVGSLSWHAQVLVLADNSFQLFPSHCKDGTGPIQTLSGPQLQLKGQGQAARADFARTVQSSADSVVMHFVIIFSLLWTLDALQAQSCAQFGCVDRLCTHAMWMHCVDSVIWCICSI